MGSTSLGKPESFVFLNLSDLHFDLKRKNLFDEAFDAFLDAINDFLVDHREWTPDCLALVGDMANRGTKEEYGKLDNYINKLKDVVGKDLIILPVPGNHDKFFPNGSKDVEKDFQEAEQFLKLYDKYITEQSKQNEKTKADRTTVINTFLKTYFGPCCT